MHKERYVEFRKQLANEAKTRRALLKEKQRLRTPSKIKSERSRETRPSAQCDEAKINSDSRPTTTTSTQSTSLGTNKDGVPLHGSVSVALDC